MDRRDEGNADEGFVMESPSDEKISDRKHDEEVKEDIGEASRKRDRSEILETSFLNNFETNQPKTPPRSRSRPKPIRVSSIFKYLQGELDVTSGLSNHLFSSPVKTPLFVDIVNGNSFSGGHSEKAFTFESGASKSCPLLGSTVGSGSASPSVSNLSEALPLPTVTADVCIIDKVEDSKHQTQENNPKPKQLPNTLTLTDEELRDSIYNFFTVPFKLEMFFFFGFCICFDALLFYFTFFPLRIIFAFYAMATNGVKRLSNSSVCDILKLVSMGINVILLFYTTDYSLLYHMVRGESTLKLYMLYNMLDVFDRLCSSFGQDSLASMCFTATDPKFKTLSKDDNYGKRRLFLNASFSFVLHIAYLYIHSVVSLLRIISLNVALNSRNNSLITMFISTNFVELKASVFKRSGKEALFQLSCRDIVERFEMVVFSIVIFFQNAISSGDFRMDEFVQILCIIIISEMVVDALKHAFICKYNNMKSDTYDIYILKLCSDLTSMSNFDSFLDNANIVSRRLGFVEGPLICLIIRLMLIPVVEFWKIQSSWFIASVIFLLTYGAIFLVKVLLSILVVGHAAKRISGQPNLNLPFLPERFAMFDKAIP